MTTTDNANENNTAPVVCNPNIFSNTSVKAKRERKNTKPKSLISLIRVARRK